MQLVAGKILDLVAMLAVWLIGIYYIISKREIWIRRLPALDFIEESIGRAAEMGRPVTMHGFGCYDEGLESYVAPQLLAAISALGYVTRLCARYGTDIYALQTAVSVIPACEEIMRTQYRLEGKLDEFEAKKADMLPWAPTPPTRVAIGWRLKPACNIMIGPFWSEAVVVSEAYNRIGAVQIGGTASLTQMPFLAAAMDMNMIGEEIYAAGAYLEKTPEMLGTIATVDIFKVIALGLIVIGVVLMTLGGSPIAALNSLFQW